MVVVLNSIFMLLAGAGEGALGGAAQGHAGGPVQQSRARQVICSPRRPAHRQHSTLRRLCRSGGITCDALLLSYYLGKAWDSESG